MIDRTPPTDRSTSATLLAESEVEARIAQIEEQRAIRVEIRRLVETGRFAEAMETAENHHISLLDVPQLLARHNEAAQAQITDLKEQLNQIQNTSRQAQELLKETVTSVQQQEMLAACFRADEALEHLDIGKLEAAVGQLQTLESLFIQRSRPVPEWFAWRLEHLRNDLEWLKSRQAEPEFYRAQDDPRQWLAFVANRRADTSRLAVLRRQQLAAVVQQQPDDNPAHLNDWSTVMTLFQQGRIEDVEHRLNQLETSIEMKRQNLTVVEALSQQNHVLIMRQYVSMYRQVTQSIMQALRDLRQAQESRVKNPQARAAYMERLYRARQRLERDQQALPPLVKESQLELRGHSHTVSQAFMQTVEELLSFRWERNND